MARPLQLRQIRIYSSPEVTRGGLVADGLPFLWTTHHVAEIFSLLLPPGYVLDGSSLVQLTCGPTQSGSDYWQALGSSEIGSGQFDFHAYSAMSQAHRQELVLNLLEEKLSDLAVREGSDPAVIRATAASVRAHGASVQSGHYTVADRFGNESFRLSGTGPNNSFKPKPLRGSA